MNELISFAQPVRELFEALKDPQTSKELVNILVLCGAAGFAVFLSLIGLGVRLYKKNIGSVDAQLETSEGMSATQAIQMVKDIKKTVPNSPSSGKILGDHV